jgi:hypothetical protein
MLLRRFLSAFPALALVALIAGFAARPALAQEIDEDAPEVSMFARILGAAGLLAIPGPGIEYKERPGLVVPPTMTNIQPAAVQPQQQTNAQPDPWNFNNPAPNPAPAPAPVVNQTSAIALPPPVDPNSVRVNNPDFPVDPEIRAAQKAKAARKKKGPVLISDDPFYGGRLLRADEMKSPGPRGNPGRVDGQDKNGMARVPSRDFGDLPVISDLWKKKEEPQTRFTGEPERQTLTQPPSGYLTPSANAPYGVVAPDRQQQDAPTVHPNMPNAPTPQTN